jgi:PAS domain-containing protein
MALVTTAEAITEKYRAVLGSPEAPLAAVERRAREMLAGERWIVWEGDASTFHFSYVSPSAAEILGYPVERWTREPTFWADIVVDPADRDDALAFCAVATGQGKDHEFCYRACAADGRTVLLHDAVQVVRGTRGVPERLRGLMVVVDPDAMEDDGLADAA